MERLLHLGRDHEQYGQTHHDALAGIHTAICPGAGGGGPSQSSKRDINEDGLLVLSEGDKALIAVSDSHFGGQAGHLVLERLAERCSRIPPSIGGLNILMAGLAQPPDQHPSGTTLTVCVLDRGSKSGFGVSFGDSCAFHLTAESAKHLNLPNEVYLHLDRPVPMDVAQIFRFEFGGGLLTLCTDGITECHYRSPATSIGGKEMCSIFREHSDPAAFNRTLVETALKGVNGHPGGQDNIALITLTGE